MFRVHVICSLLFALFDLVAFSQANQDPASVENVRVSKLNVNTVGNDYAPVIQNGKLLFTSDYRERFGVYFSSTDSLSQLSGIYLSDAESDTTFSAPRLIDNRLNRCYNSGPAWINPDGTQLYFSSNEPTRFFLFSSKTKGKLKIYQSTLEAGKWSKRVQLPFCDNDFNFTHPYLNATEDTMYFSSDCDGGFGGYDLYYSVKVDDNWSEPVNLGEEINSPVNDVFPFYDGECFAFSSERESGFGKLDIFTVEQSTKTIQHLERPFNSEADDFAFVTVNKDKGYFSSNREGNDELYFFNELFPTFKECTPYEKDPFCFTFFEESDDLEENLNLEYVWNFGDGVSASGKESRHCFQGYGEYLVELNIVDRTTSKVFYNQSTYPFTIEHSYKIHLEGPDTIPPSTDVFFTSENSFLEDYEIQNYFWEVDNGQMRFSETDNITLNFDSQGIHEIKLGVKTKSVETGAEVKWCVTKTIVVVNGAVYEPSNDLHVVEEWNETTDEEEVQYTLFLGVSDTLVNVQTINAVDSLKVQSVGDSLYMYSMGVSEKKAELLDEFRMAQEMGFTNSQVTEIKNGTLVQSEKLAHTPTVEIENIIDNRIKKEQILATFEVFYGFDVFALTKANKELLRKLALEHKSATNIKVLISSFTDVKGKSAYNLELSKKRSIAVRDELVKNGLPLEWIELEYYGMRVPLSMEPLSDAQRRKSLIIFYESN